jgi:hypothetical protein
MGVVAAFTLNLRAAGVGAAELWVAWVQVSGPPGSSHSVGALG